MNERKSKTAKAASTAKDLLPAAKQVLPVAVAVVVPILIFGFLIVAKLSKTTGGSTPAVSASEGILLYTGQVPVRAEPSMSSDVVYYLPMATDEKTGKQKDYGFLTTNDLGGARISADGSIWIIVVFREEIVYQEYYSDDQPIREEMYVPVKYFAAGPGAGGVPFLKMIDLG
jgi:hypothetical protein